MSEPEEAIRRNAAQLVPGEDRAALVYVHGYGCGQAVWRPLVQRQAGRRRQILLELAGHGSASPDGFDPARYPTLDAYAQDVIEVCEAFDATENTTLVAHSIGCNLALRAARARPGYFSRLILIGATPCFQTIDGYPGGFAAAELESLLDLLERNPTAWAGHLAGIVAGGDEGAASWLRTSFCSMDPRSARHFARLTFFVDDRALLPAVTVPATLLHHANDALVPLAVAEFTARTLPHGQLVTLEVVGHAAHMTAPDLVAAHLER